MLSKVILAAADAADNAVERVILHHPSDGSLEMAKQAISRYDQASWVLLPLVGALVACGGCIILSPPATKREAGGRSIFGIFFGVCLVWLAGDVDWVSIYVQSPAAKLLFGCLAGLAIYGLSKPFVVKWIRRSDGIASDGVELIASKIPGRPNEQDHPTDH